MSRCPGPHLLSCGLCGETDATLHARAEAAERERNRLRMTLERLTYLYESEQDTEALERIGRPAWLQAALYPEEGEP